MATPSSLESLIAPGAQVVVRDEDWLVRSVAQTATDGLKVRVIGTSELVREQEATFLTHLDEVRPLRPEATRLVPDPTPGFRRGRLYLEALLRKTPLPLAESRLAVGHRQLLDPLDYQRRPVRVALEALRPRLLIADAVGLGKTLEVGMLLSELIRRGRGDRILVVTPRHILEQFQHELWTRFAIPLVRLDSEGIQRVRQKIPATRNPFTYYKRVIISIDTLKNAGRYRHHLENITWDAVVIDECHNLVNRGTLNNQLARVLAPRTEALILTSATPHNGKPESFAELVRLLDPTAIADPKRYGRDEIQHLYLRRHKNSSDVAAEVGAAWADRLKPQGVPVAASPAENAVLDELADLWLYPRDGRSPASGPGRRLLPWTLLKAFLSSHWALAETIASRRRTLAEAAITGAGGRSEAEREREDEALQRLQRLLAKIDDQSAAKLAGLVETLRRIGVGPGSPTRAVVFSERHATLEWLAQAVPARLGLGRDAVRVLHGGLADVEQQRIVEEFALAESPVRLLLTGDIAAEGVNLHRQCHDLVHFDLPWSLITIEQRNGRIDRYGQEHPPRVWALLLVPRHPRVRGDLDVLARLLDKEDAAHRTLGDAGSLMGLRSASEEEEAITRAIAEHRPLDEVVPDQPRGEFDLLMALTGGDGAAAPVATVTPPRLFDSDEAFLDEALREVYEDPDRELEIRRSPEHRLLSLVPPEDLRRRLEVLPQSYLAEQKVLERLRLTADREVALERLRLARERSRSLWPDVLYLSSQHPVLDWATDKVLARLGRNEALVLVAEVASPTFLILGMYSNKRGQPTIVEWMAIDRLPDYPHVRPLEPVLREARVGAAMANPGQGWRPADLADLQDLVPRAVEEARGHMKAVRDEAGRVVAERVEAYAARLRAWRREAERLALAIEVPGFRQRREREVEAVAGEVEKLIGELGTSGEPLVRVVAVLVPPGRRAGAGFAGGSA
jgi:superfamily II DNA or RNA helicase